MPRPAVTALLRLAALACSLVAAPRCLAQHGGPGGGHAGGGMGPAGMGPGGMGSGSMPGNSPGFSNGYGPRDYGHGGPPPGNAPDSAGGMRGGLQLGPPGRWWDDTHFAKDLKLRPEQQRRMDAIFESNKPALMGRLGTVLQEETRMEALTRAKNPDEGTLNSEIDRLWQARAELEKAKTHYLLRIRQEMDADQISRLEEHR